MNFLNFPISHNLRPPIKMLLQNISDYYELQLQNWKAGKGISKQGMDLFPLLPDLQSKNFFYKTFPIYQGFQNQEMESYTGCFKKQNQIQGVTSPQFKSITLTLHIKSFHTWNKPS